MTGANERLSYRGGCLGGAVRLHVLAPASVEVEECSCSICSKGQP